ncbi:MAG: hypothetical protein KAY65_08025 [Planctomycetes bacterium]|nr:hypothetical protein [Planctomycetota bacterium]
MKHTNYYLISSVLIVVLSVPAMSRTELPPFREPQPGLIARAHPELSHINSLQVAIVPSGTELIKDNFLWKDLRTKVEQKLKQAGIKIPPVDYVGRRVVPFRIPQLNIHVDMLKLEDARQYIFLIRTSLARPVCLPPGNAAPQDFKPISMFKANVWTKAYPMQVAASQHTVSRMTQIVLQQTEVFTAAWTAANPPDQQASDANDVNILPKKTTERPADSPPAEYKYVASKNSKVFHSPDCRFAGTISPKNLVGYKTRKDAINAGKRPCKVCKP